MKYIYILFAVFLQNLLVNTALAQREYWGYQATNDTSGGFKNYGRIFKTDSLGKNLTIVYAFDSIHGMTPNGRLFLASNGKLYGMTNRGGNGTNAFGGSRGNGVFFEYDLSINRYKVLYHLGTTQMPAAGPSGLFTETSGGNLFTIMENLGSSSVIYKYNTRTNSLTHVYTTPLVKSGITTIFTNTLGSLALAKNGKLYGAVGGDQLPSCSPSPGNIFRIDTNSNVFTKVFMFPCIGVDGGGPGGNLIEWSNGKLYGLAGYGTNNAGVIFEFNYNTNVYTKKYDLPANTFNNDYRNVLTKASNNKFYGLTQSGGGDIHNVDYGTLYEYDPVSNVYSVKHKFGLIGTDNQGFAIYSGLFPFGKLLEASNGKLYGHTLNGVFEYDIAKDTLVQTSKFDFFYQNSVTLGAGLIEICRKPSYDYFEVDTFHINAGEAFQYTIQSTNANTYQWTRNGTILSNQKTKTLDLVGQSGTYSCTMTNQCGTTKTMNLVVTVNTVTGQEETELTTNCTLSPNPFNQHSTLVFDTEQKNTLVKITDLAGKELKSILFSGKQLTIEKADLKEGIYMLSILDQYNRMQKKRMVVY